MFVLFALMLLVIISTPAHAYVDAGSGSYMLQMALAGIMALMFTAKLYWQRIISFVSRRRRDVGQAEVSKRVGL